MDQDSGARIFEKVRRLGNTRVHHEGHVRAVRAAGMTEHPTLFASRGAT